MNATSTPGSMFGDATDGSQIISTNTVMTRDMFWQNLTINSGVTLFTNGYRIFVLGMLTNNGTISNAGQNGLNAVPGNDLGTGLGGTGAPGGSVFGGGVGAPGGGYNVFTGGIGGASIFTVTGSHFMGGSISSSLPCTASTGLVCSGFADIMVVHSDGNVDNAYFTAGPGPSSCLANPINVYAAFVLEDLRANHTTPPSLPNDVSFQLLTYDCASGIWESAGAYIIPTQPVAIDYVATVDTGFFGPTGFPAEFCDAFPNHILGVLPSGDSRVGVDTGIIGLPTGNVAGELLLLNCFTHQWCGVGPAETGSFQTCATGLVNDCSQQLCGGNGGFTLVNSNEENLVAITAAFNPILPPTGISAFFSGGSGGGSPSFDCFGSEPAGGGGGGGVIVISGVLLLGSGLVDVHGGNAGTPLPGGMASGGGGGGLILIHTVSPLPAWTYNVSGGQGSNHISQANGQDGIVLFL